MELGQRNCNNCYSFNYHELCFSRLPRRKCTYCYSLDRQNRCLLFLLGFGATNLHHILKSSFSFWLMMNRKYWGISFAIIHLFHLLALGTLQHYFHPVFTLAATFSLFAGGTAYLFILLMFLTSFNTFSKLISRKVWKRLHLIGGHWIWIVFMSSYWKRILQGETGYLPIALMLVLVMGIRLWGSFQHYFKTKNS